MKRIQIAVIAMLLAFVTLLSATPSFSQTKTADSMQVFRDKLRADKKLYVTRVMQLTESEFKGFWPVYESYQTASDKLDDRLLKLIEDYATHYKATTNEAARKMVDDYLLIERDRQQLRQSYLVRFRQVLTDVNVARFYQLENKMQAAVNYDLAEGIPLID